MRASSKTKKQMTEDAHSEEWAGGHMLRTITTGYGQSVAVNKFRRSPIPTRWRCGVGHSLSSAAISEVCSLRCGSVGAVCSTDVSPTKNDWMCASQNSEAAGCALTYQHRSLQVQRCEHRIIVDIDAVKFCSASNHRIPRNNYSACILHITRSGQSLARWA